MYVNTANSNKYGININMHTPTYVICVLCMFMFTYFMCRDTIF